MELWNIWVTLIENSMVFFSSQVGMTEAVAIIAFTLLARVTLLPVSYKSAYNMYKNKLAMQTLKPDIDRLKSKYKDDPVEFAKVTMSLYKEKGVQLLDKTSVLNMFSQGVLGVGIFQALKGMVFNSKFMWIPDLAKPDMILAVLIALLTFLTMALMPGAAEQSSWMFIVIPLVISLVVYFSFPSALGIYMLTSNLVTVVQSAFLQYIISRESKAITT